MKTYIIYIVILFSSLKILAQKKGSQDLSIGYGVLTSNQFIEVISDLAVEIISLGTAVDYENYSSSGAINLNYKYVVSNRFLVGGTFIFERATTDIVDGNNKIGERETNFNTIAFELDYRYISNPSFQMYSGLGGGYTFGNQDFSVNSGVGVTPKSLEHDYFNFQINALGFRFGRKFAGFLELGFGYKGILNLGISTQF